MGANSKRTEIFAQWLILAVYLAIAIGRESFAVTAGVELLLAFSSIVMLRCAAKGVSILGALSRFLGRKATAFLMACLYFLVLASINYGKLPTFQRAGELVRSPVSATATIQPLYRGEYDNGGRLVYQFIADNQPYEGQGARSADMPASDGAFTGGVVYYLASDPNISSLDPAEDFRKAGLGLILSVAMLQALAAALFLEVSKQGSATSARTATA